MFPPAILTLEAFYVKTRTVSDERALPCAMQAVVFPGK